MVGGSKNVLIYNKTKHNNNQVIILAGKYQQLLYIRERNGKGTNKSKDNLAAEEASAQILNTYVSVRN